MSVRYARMAREYYREYQPAGMTDLAPEFFAQLGREIEARVEQVTRSLQQTEPTEPDYLRRVGQLANQRLRAEEVALSEFLPTPEATS